jgi:trehalose 6-phosphate synthase
MSDLHRLIWSAFVELFWSQFAGAAVECAAALLVNPYDPEAVGTPIEQALSMPLNERRALHDALFQVLMANDVRSWGERSLVAGAATGEAAWVD